MITLSSLNKAYEEVKNEDIDSIVLKIHMPTGEKQIIKLVY